MKRYTLLVSVLATTLFSSCSKEFITLEPVINNTAEKLFADTTDYVKITNGIYAATASLYSTDLPPLLELRSDNLFHTSPGSGAGVEHSLHIFSENTTNTYVVDGYRKLYQVIFRANFLLDKLGKASNISAVNKAQYTGEASFFRALAFFNLVRMFGGVPLNLISLENGATYLNPQGRASAQEVYQQIIKDLQVAIDNLPASYPAAQLGRVQKVAASALLGKVYLTMQDWGNAVSTLKNTLILHQANNVGIDAMMLKATYTTATTAIANLKSIFGIDNISASEEVLFALRYQASATLGGNFLNKMNSIYGITDGLKLEAFNVLGDVRIAANKIVKLPAANATNLPYGFPLIRYADVLLMLAEALNEQAYSSASGVAITAANYASMPSAASTTQTAYDLINRVRWRAGLTTLLTESNLDAQLNTKNTVVATTNQEKLRKYIFEERRRELCYEMQRWFDIIRYGTGGIDPKTGSPVTSLGITILNAYVPTASVQRFLYPIPAQEIAVHNNASTFPQNAGY